MKASRTFVGGSVALVLIAAGAPQTVADDGRDLTGEAKRKVIRAAAQAMVDGYIHEDVAMRMAERVAADFDAGKYDDLRSPEEFARVLTEDLRAVSNDKHLGVSVNRPEPTRQESPVRQNFAELNYGFVRVEVLEGNVGYLDLRGFLGTETGLAQADAAMTLMADVDSLIIDLGRNGGGDERMVRYLSTYLFDKPTHLVDTFARGMEKPRERWTMDSVPGKRLAHVPVYLLVSGQTFSAAESFSFGLRVNGRVTIVGERTGGGGHFGGLQPLAEGFSIWLPRGRTYDPRTGKGWEASGLKPDIEVEYGRALSLAHEHARAKVRK
jgi:C-terminal processing protease CtpA/Prc